MWWTLLAGAAALILWAWFVLGFTSEPSVVGRSKMALDFLIGSSLGTAALGVVAAVALVARRRWAPSLAVVASVFMILTIVGAIAGVPALVGLLSSRNPGRN